MKIRRTALAIIVAVTFVALKATPSSAQRAGFQVAIAPAIHPMVHPTVNPPLVIPGFAQPMVVPFTTAPFTVSPFPGVSAPFTVGPFPGFVAPFLPPVIVTRPPIHHRRSHGFAPGIVVTTVPGSFQGQFGPGPVSVVPAGPPIQTHFRPPTVSGIPAVPTAPRTHPGSPAVTIVPIGTPRAQVLAQFGRPSITVLTSNNETLYFGGGVTIIIQNDRVVAGPK